MPLTIQCISTSQLIELHQAVAKQNEENTSEEADGEMEKEINKSAVMNDELLRQFKLMRTLKPIDKCEIESKKVILSDTKKRLSPHTLIFDLDETLVHVIPFQSKSYTKPYFQKLSYFDKFSKKEVSVLAFKRPYVDLMLRSLNEYFELVVLI